MHRFSAQLVNYVYLYMGCLHDTSSFHNFESPDFRLLNLRFIYGGIKMVTPALVIYQIRVMSVKLVYHFGI